MRFLKNKIARAEAFLASQPQVYQTRLRERRQRDEQASSKEPEEGYSYSQTDDKDSKEFESPDRRSTKNIAKNFGKAICNFAVSPLAEPYLLPLLNKEGIDIAFFKGYLSGIKSDIDGLFKFRSLLIIVEEESAEVQATKRVFRDLGEVFIKYFSVNWIFHGRVIHKKAHLKYRFKMLRRIRNPELFTYLR